MGLIVRDRKYALIKSMIFTMATILWFMIILWLLNGWFLTYLLCSHRLPCTVLWRQPDKDNDDGFWWLLLLMMMMIVMISKQWLLITHISCLLSENEAQTAVILTISNDATGNSVSPENASEKNYVESQNYSQSPVIRKVIIKCQSNDPWSFVWIKDWCGWYKTLDWKHWFWSWRIRKPQLNCLYFAWAITWIDLMKLYD